MRSKHVITLLVIVAIVVLIVILLATVFAVRNVYVACYDLEGNPIVVSGDNNIANAVLEQFEGDNVLTLQKSNVQQWINQQYPHIHALKIVVEFPNILRVHLVERQTVYLLQSHGTYLQIDSFGYVIGDQEFDEADFGKYLVITDCFETQVTHSTIGQRLLFASDVDNDRLDIVIATCNALWQLKYNYHDIVSLINNMQFNADNSIMTIVTAHNANIVVHAPKIDLAQRIIKAYSVYTSDSKDFQVSGAVITVFEDGRIRTPKIS